MTPAARYAAAIEVLDRIIAGDAAERALTHWARSHRFAGSGDRAAIRDHVYDVLRARRSLGVVGGGGTGRALVLGLLCRDGIAPDAVFGVGGHAPAALVPGEWPAAQRPLTNAETSDLPDWLWPLWQDALGADAFAVARLAQQRAGLHLRVNRSRATRATAQARLMDESIATVPHPQVETGLIVTDNPRRVAGSGPFADGWVEVQDAASQIAIAQLPLTPGQRVLDYCAGGGGKALAIADRLGGPVWAHDIAPARMGDIPARAARAGVKVQVCTTDQLAHMPSFDLVLCDAPCSGSGTWRRTPDAKWRLTPEMLCDLNTVQADVLMRGSELCTSGGVLAYATCSVLTCENDTVVASFLADNDDWTADSVLRLQPSADTDGFYMAVLRKN